MTATVRPLLVWSPRLLGLAYAGFIGIFAADAIRHGPVAVLMHLLPSFVVLAVVALAWRWPWVGAAAFAALAVLYAVVVRRWDWIAPISGPLVLLAVLYLRSWRATVVRS